MASTTTNLGLTKPAYSDDADISDINGNMDLIDAEAGKVRANVAANYDSSETYAVGDYCLHDGSLYKCSTAISSPEAWTAGHWTQIKITGELSTLNGNITPSAYNTTGISYSDAYSAFTSGGYFTIGNLVVLNIVVIASESRTSTSKMFELPASVKPKHSIALTTMNIADDLAPQYSIATNSGGVFIKNIVANKPYSIFGCWLKS